MEELIVSSSKSSDDLNELENKENRRRNCKKICCCICCCCRCFLCRVVLISQYFCYQKIFQLLCLNPFTEITRYILTVGNTVLFYLSLGGVSERVIDFDYFYINLMFITLHTVDVICRIIAQGFHKTEKSFIRTSVWNAFDLSLVVGGWALIWLIELTPFRILVFVGLLKHVPVFSLLTMIINSSWRSLFRMKGMLLLIIVTLMMFSMMGVDFFKSDIGKQCIVDEFSNDTYYVKPIPSTIWCSTTDSLNGLIGMLCPEGMSCVTGQENLYGGVASFDNFGSSLLSTFQIVTLSGWTIFFQAMSSATGTLLTSLWMMPLVFVVAFLMMNLIITAMEITFALFFVSHHEKRDRSNPTTKMFFRLLREIPRSVFGKMKYYIKVRVLGKLCLRDDIPFCFTDYECCKFLYECVSGTIKFFISPACYHRIERFWMILFEATSLTFILFYVTVVTIHQIVGITDEDFLLVVQCFCYVVLAELVIRILIYRVYFLFNVLNLMDLFVVPIACISLTVELVDSDSMLGDLQYLVLMRLFRLVEIFKFLFISKNFMRKLIISIPPTLVLMVFSFIVMYFFAQAGTQIFEEVFTGPKNFNNMQYSMRTLFVIFSGDNWEDNMYEALAISGDEYEGWIVRITSVPYFLFYFVISNYLLMNFFIVIVMHSFDTASEEDDRYFVKIFDVIKLVILKIWCCGSNLESNDSNTVIPVEFFSGRIKGKNEEEADGEVDEITTLEDLVDLNSVQLQKETGRIIRSPQRKSVDDDGVTNIDIEIPLTGPNEGTIKQDLSTKIIQLIKRFFRCCFAMFMCPGKTLNFLSRSIVDNGLYNLIMIFFTLFSTTLLFWENPAESYKDTVQVSWYLFYFDYGLCAVFLLDFALKVASLGPLYFVDIFNLCDFVTLLELIATIIVVNLLGNELTFTMFYVRRIRLLRPIRLLNHLPDIKIYLTAIYRSVLSFVNIVGLYLITLFVFALIGTFLFSTDLNRCNDTSITYDPSTQTFEEYEDTCVGYFNEGEYGLFVPRSMTMLNFEQGDNFVHTAHSLFALFTVSTLSDWSTLMFHIESSQSDDQMKAVVNVYFALYVTIVGFFIVNLVVGVIMDKITDVRGMDDLTDSQLAWMELKRYIHEVKPKVPIRRPPKNRCFKICYCAGNNTVGKRITMVIFLVNCIIICIQWNDQPVEWTWIIEGLTYLCIMFYVIEDLITSLSIGCYRFIKNTPIIIEMVLAFILFMGLPVFPILGLDLDLMRLYGKFISRMILLLRIYRYAFHSKFIQKLATGFRLAIPSILNAGFLLLVIIFCYACVGRATFGNVRFQRFYTEGWSFRNWTDSILLMIRILTLDNWNLFVHELSIRPPYCTDEAGFNDCSPSEALSYVFFVSFIILAGSIILNLFIAIILDNFQHLCKKDNFTITRKDIRTFLDVWSRYDPKAKGKMRLNQFPNLCHTLAKENHLLGLDNRIGKGKKRLNKQGTDWEGPMMMNETQFLLSCIELSDGVKYTKQEKQMSEKLTRFNLVSHLKEATIRFLNVVCCVLYYSKRIYQRIKEERKRIRLRKEMEYDSDDDFDIRIEEDVHPLNEKSKKKVRLREVLLTLCRFHVPNFCKTQEERDQRLEWFKIAYSKLKDFRKEVISLNKRRMDNSFQIKHADSPEKLNQEEEEEKEEEEEGEKKSVKEEVRKEEDEKNEEDMTIIDLCDASSTASEKRKKKKKKKKKNVKERIYGVSKSIRSFDKVINSPTNIRHSIREKFESSIKSTFRGIPVVSTITNTVIPYDYRSTSDDGDYTEDFSEEEGEEEGEERRPNFQEEEVEIEEKENLLGELGIRNLDLKNKIGKMRDGKKYKNLSNDESIGSPSNNDPSKLKRK